VHTYGAALISLVDEDFSYLAVENAQAYSNNGEYQLLTAHTKMAVKVSASRFFAPT
jgi:hypothetical protein